MATVNTANLTLTAGVIVRESENPKRGYKKISDVVIYAGPLSIARATFPGEYTQTQALAQFKMNRRFFKEGKDFSTAKQLDLF